MVEVDFLFPSETNSVLHFCLHIVLDQHIAQTGILAALFNLFFKFYLMNNAHF